MKKSPRCQARAAIEAKLAGTKAQLEPARAASKLTTRPREVESRQPRFTAENLQVSRPMLAVKTKEQYKALQHEIDFAQQEIQGQRRQDSGNYGRRRRQVCAGEGRRGRTQGRSRQRSRKKRRLRTTRLPKTPSFLPVARETQWPSTGVPEDWVAHYERSRKPARLGFPKPGTQVPDLPDDVAARRFLPEVRAGHN